MNANIQARLAWALINAIENLLAEPAADYSGLLEGMEANELLQLIEQANQRLEAMGAKPPGEPSCEPPIPPVRLYINSQYIIRQGSRTGPELPLRPLVKSIFILFLKHPEGIILKQRSQYRKELEGIYAVIAPSAGPEVIRSRIERLVSLQDNSFSEKASVLNARLEEILPAGTAEGYKIHGTNGHPRRIPLSPLAVEWI